MTRTLLCVFLPFVILLCSGEVCVDKNSNCRFWDEAINHCELNADYMADTCPVTCNKCGPCRNVSCYADRECVSTSTDAGATYTCPCSDGYTGSDCSDSPCKNVTDCMNQGKCVVDATDPRGYSCYCPLGITGTYCEDCADSNVNCEYWASIGECTRNPSHMLMNCRVSCNTCPDNPCTNNTVCQNGGSCVVNVTTARRFSCDCPPGTLDPDCESYNPCDPNPCQNGGTCNQDGSCNCTGTGFMGTTCTEINPCETATPCQNGGLCTPNGICNCSGTGFMGVTCENNPCTNNTVCQNGGSCVVNVTTARRFSCDCPPGTLDPDCESYNPCDPNPCQNGGTCNQDGSCNCTGTGFMGTTCTEINPCETATPCQNGGLCTPNGICNCSGTGFMGVTCESVRTAEANQDLNSIQESQPSIFEDNNMLFIAAGASAAVLVIVAVIVAIVCLKKKKAARKTGPLLKDNSFVDMEINGSSTDLNSKQPAKGQSMDAAPFDSSSSA